MILLKSFLKGETFNHLLHISQAHLSLRACMQTNLSTKPKATPSNILLHKQHRTTFGRGSTHLPTQPHILILILNQQSSLFYSFWKQMYRWTLNVPHRPHFLIRGAHGIDNGSDTWCIWPSTRTTKMAFELNHHVMHKGITTNHNSII